MVPDFFGLTVCHTAKRMPPNSTTLSQLIVRSTATRLIESESLSPNRISSPVNPPSTKPKPPGVGIVVNIAFARAANITIPHEISSPMASATK